NGDMYHDAFATFAVCDAASHTNAVSYRVAAEKAVRAIERAHHKGKGWRYTASSTDNDASITPCCMLALRAARNAGIEVSPRILQDGRDYMASCTSADGHVGYTGPDDDDERGAPANTASGMLCRIFVDHELEREYSQKVYR